MFSILFHFCQDHVIQSSYRDFISTSRPLQQPGHMLLFFFLLEFFTTTASVAAATTTTGFTGICLSDVLSGLTEKHNLGLIGVSSCKSFTMITVTMRRGVCHADVSVVAVLRDAAPLIGRWAPVSVQADCFSFCNESKCSLFYLQCYRL